MKAIVYMIVVALVAVLLFFWFGVIHSFWQALVAWVVVAVIAFLFYDSGSQRHRYCRQQPRIGHDPDDPSS